MVSARGKMKVPEKRGSMLDRTGAVLFRAPLKVRERERSARVEVDWCGAAMKAAPLETETRRYNMSGSRGGGEGSGVVLCLDVRRRDLRAAVTAVEEVCEVCVCVCARVRFGDVM